VYIYRSYYKNKYGGPFFGTPCIWRAGSFTYQVLMNILYACIFRTWRTGLLAILSGVSAVSEKGVKWCVDVCLLVTTVTAWAWAKRLNRSRCRYRVGGPKESYGRHLAATTKFERSLTARSGLSLSCSNLLQYSLQYFSPHRQHYKLDAGCSHSCSHSCLDVAWSVCLSVCWSHEWALLNGSTDRDAIWGCYTLGSWCVNIIVIEYDRCALSLQAKLQWCR